MLGGEEGDSRAGEAAALDASPLSLQLLRFQVHKEPTGMGKPMQYFKDECNILKTNQAVLVPGF